MDILRLMPAARTRNFPALLLTILLLTLTSLPAQTVDTVGSTAVAPSGSLTSKGNIFRVDQTSMLLNIEFYLDVPGPETLIFFMMRHHSRDGIGSLVWSTSVPVNGTGIGPAWYGTGIVTMPVVGGNHYLLGVAWSSSLTYYYARGTAAGTPVSFGSWVGGKTPRFPVPQTFSFTGLDIAQYHQRVTSIPIGAANTIGIGCPGSSTLVPRLVASDLFRVGTQPALELVNGAGSIPAALALGVGPTLPTPIPFMGCNIWLGNVIVTFPAMTTAAGYASFPFSIPQNPTLSGLQLQTQCILATVAPGFTNAMELIVN